MKKIKLFFISFLFLTIGIVVNSFSQTATYTVTKTTDLDPYAHPYNFVDSLCDSDMYGTLAWAIRKSNDDNIPSIILFDIPGAGVHTIYLNYELPINIVSPKTAAIFGDLTIDGTSQQGYQNEPLIIIDGQGNIERGLYFNGQANYNVKGIGIQNFLIRGILFVYADNILIENCVITQINNTSPDYSATAIRILGNPKIGYSDAIIRNNYLGTNAQLDTTLGCDDAGILIGPDANNNLIFGNTIACNHQAGIYFQYLNY